MLVLLLAGHIVHEADPAVALKNPTGQAGGARERGIGRERQRERGGLFSLPNISK